jgi:hypothetical protein
MDDRALANPGGVESMIDMSPDEFRRLGYRAVDLIADNLASLRSRPCRSPVPPDVQHALMHQPLPHEPSEPDALIDYVGSTFFRYPIGNGSPRFFGWVNSPPAPIGVLAELLAAALNPSVAGGDHAATYLEHGVLDWIRQIVGVPSWSGGILTSGGSVANLIGLAVMRQVKTSSDVRAACALPGQLSWSTRPQKGIAVSRKRLNCSVSATRTFAAFPCRPSGEWIFRRSGVRSWRIATQG